MKAAWFASSPLPGTPETSGLALSQRGEMYRQLLFAYFTGSMISAIDLASTNLPM
jgi:hypothetical protein